MKRFLLLSCVHFVLLLGLIVLSMDFSAIDDGQPALARRVAGWAAGALGQPGFAVHRALGERATDVTEWLVFVANSLLWGGGLALVFGWLRPSAA